jgi:hypothetical protein
MAKPRVHDILNGEGQEGEGGVFTVDTGEDAFAFPAAVEESDENLGQLLTVLGSRDEFIPGVINTLAAAQRASGEAAKDEDQDMVREDGHFIPLVGGLLLYLDEDLVERGR